MTYPLSSDVSAGQPTAVNHYNYLRSDALYLGNTAADSIDIGSLLARYQSGLTIDYLATSRVRVPASATAPVKLMIDGVMCTATSNVDLAALAAPSGGAAWWYFFAVKAAGTTTFTLDSNTSITETAGRRRIARCYWNGSAITQLQTEDQYNFYYDFSLVPTQICNGRLTLETGVAVSTTDQADKTTLYFTPYQGDRVSVYITGEGWIVRKFSELSLAIGAFTASKPYDIFLYDNSGTLTLEGLVWTNATTRATAIALQDGTYVKSGDLTRRYIGTIYMDAASKTQDTVLRRFVWNYYNRLPRKLKVFETTDSWAYTTATWRSFNNSTANRVEVVTGVAENTVYIRARAGGYNTTATVGRELGIGLDVTNANSCVIKSTTSTLTLEIVYNEILSVGYHFLQMTEFSEASGASTWYGDQGNTTIFQSGIDGEVIG